MHIETLVLGTLSTNCYIISDASDATHCIVVDPAAQFETIKETLGDRSVEAIVLTHRHFDHIGALSELAAYTGAPVYAHELDADAIPDPDANCSVDFMKPFATPLVGNRLEEGDTVRCGCEVFTVIHTPGHTQGSMCLYNAAHNVLIAGDTLFYGTTGRTDLPTGSPQQMRASCTKLARLPDETVVYPGHDRVTTIKAERGRVLPV